jgi:hypothetical protein
LALPLFAITLFVSAFLLFLVQPMIGKMILPKLGGTPQVWNTCMMFFQMVLLAGYAYTHTLTTRLPVRKQIFVHLGLLVLPLLFLLPNGPFNVTGWEPPVGTNPIWATLGLLAIVVGVPFLVVSTSAPLLQRWFGETGHPSASDPYFLYGASNLGSLLSLLAYPFLVEPWLVLHDQAIVWVVGYGILAAMIAFCIYLVRQGRGVAQFQLAGAPSAQAKVPEPVGAAVAAPAVESSTAVKEGPAPSKPAQTGITRAPKKKGLRPGQAPARAPSVVERVGPIFDKPRSDVVTWGRRIRWILLAAIPTSLMLGVTSYVSTDLSPFPLLWVIPLALYLLTFVFVFAKWPVPWTDVPHQIVLYVQPFGVLALCFIMFQGGFAPFLYTFIAFGGFFLTALMCHGELARDRPSTRYLTEFFLLMSVGGALGGTFNALVAPNIFTMGVVEYPLAIFLSCFLRPALTQNGWVDDLLISAFPGLETWAQERGDEMAKSFGKEPPHTNYLLNYSLDILLPVFLTALAYVIRVNIASINRFIGNTDSIGVMNLIQFGVPMCFAFFFAWRPVRFGLAVGGMIMVFLVWAGGRDDHTLYRDRSYFGVLRVLEGGEGRNNFTYLMHGTTYHGRCYYDPDIERVATTYYHRMGPVGKIMERYYWWSPTHANPPRQVTGADLVPDKARGYNPYAADARMPAGIIGTLAASLGSPSNLPLDAIVHGWSEPPYATIGLGTGTMASYARPFQHMTYYEIDQKIVNFSLPPPGRKTYFTYLNRAIRRGVNLELIMGDARQSMKVENPASSRTFLPDYDSDEGVLEVKDIVRFQGREKYYKVLNVDAFSSDAIPLHLITVEAVQLYMSKIADDGVLCMHTSNRHMDLVAPLTDICKELKLKYRVGHDQGTRDQGAAALGHFGSEYVMIARDEKLLPPRTPRPIPLGQGWQQTWETPPVAGRRVWTDDYSNILSVLR